MGKRKLKPGDVVQLITCKNPSFANCFMTILKVEEWGVIGYIMIPRAKGTAQSAYRCGFEEFNYIGQALFWEE